MTSVASMGRWVAALLMAAILAGCTSVAPTPQAPAPAAETDTTPTPPVSAQKPVSAREEPRPYEYPARSFDKETLYQLLVGEIAGYRGQYEIALDKYLAMAEETRDPGVAARATRLAAYLKQDRKAVEAAKIWAEQEPDSLDAHRHAVDKLMKVGDLEGAIHHMEAVKRLGGLANFDVFAYRAADLDPESRKSLLKAVSSMLERYPGDRQLMFARGVLLSQEGRQQEAVDIANQLLAEEKDINTMILKVTALKAMGRTDDAIEFLGSAVEAIPDNRRLRLIYARHLFEDERLDDAQRQYQAVLDRNPDDGDIMFALALIAMEQDRDDEAKKYLHRMIRRDQRAGEAHYYLGSIAEKNGDIPGAIREYKQAGSGYEFLPARSRVAELLIEQGRLAEAHSYLENLRVAHPGRHDDLIQLEAQVLSEHGFEDRAMDLLDQALAEDPDNIDLLYSRAMTAERIGRLDILERDLRRILEIDPDNTDALNALGYTLTDQTDRHHEALALIKKALEIKPNEAAYIDSLGWVQYRLKNYDKAIANLRKALDMFPNDEVAAHLGEVLWVSGQKEEAERVWQRALDRKPDSEILKNVIQRLRGEPI